MKVNRKTIYKECWETSCAAVQRKYNLKPLVFKEICRLYEIPTPTQAYWLALHYGKGEAIKPELPPLPPNCESEEIELDIYTTKKEKSTTSKSSVREAKQNIKIEEPVSHTIKHVSGYEADVQMLEQKLAAISKDSNQKQGTTSPSEISPFIVPDILTPKHPLILDTIAKHRETEYYDEHGWKVKQNPFKCKSDHYLSLYVTRESFDRAMRIYTAIVLGAESLGYSIIARNDKKDKDGTFIMIQGEEIGITLEEKNKRIENPDSSSYNKYLYVPSSFLCVKILREHRWESPAVIQDTKKTRLEDKIEHILICAKNEAESRKEYRRQQEIAEAEWKRKEEEKRIAEELRKKKEAERKSERKKLQSLLIEVERYHVAVKMREYIEAFKESIKKQDIQISTEIEEDIFWMENKTAWMDPFTNRQDEYLTEDDYKEIIYPQKEEPKESYSWYSKPPKTEELSFWQLKNIFGSKR